MQQICTCMHIRTFVILHPYEKVFTWVLRVTCILKDFILFLAIIRTTWQCIWLIIEGSDVFCPITYVLGLYLDYAAKKQCCNGNNHKLVGSCCLRYVYIAAMALEWVNGHENISVESWSLWKKNKEICFVLVDQPFACLSIRFTRITETLLDQYVSFPTGYN